MNMQLSESHTWNWVCTQPITTQLNLIIFLLISVEFLILDQQSNLFSNESKDKQT